ncbi:MAG: AAA family ATPase [Bacilli bacterium]|nr:AAA family ATPase [Bacilli bacterium]
MVLLVGASASGKTEIAKYLFSRYGMVKAITHTTRPMRKGERKDVDYHFVTVEEFLRLKEANALVESTEYNGNYYGCSKAECGDDKCIILDPSGIHSFLSLGDSHIVTFFLRTKESTRLERMRKRGDEEESIRKRLRGDRVTFDPKNLPPVDYVLDCDEDDVATIGDEIYRLYQGKLSD